MREMRLPALLLVIVLFLPTAATSYAGDLRVGAAVAELAADDSMVVAGGILARHVKGQEGKLRAVAVVLERPGQAMLAVVACDILMMNRDLLDPVAMLEELAR